MLDVFDLVATITLDRSKYDEELDKSRNDLSSFGSKLAGGLKTVGTVTAGAIAAGATAVGALAAQAVSAYGEYEQLAGGVEKLFGEKTAQTVINNAKQAFETAGMSANEYMETVTGFSAALLKSVGGDTEKAANLADLALRDMSDNANVFGSDMESIQNAYSGFSRGNFTMLDNLKLGFAGTKEGMEELLETASGLTGQSYSIDSYADIVEAIHAVQEAQNIAGTTAKEAAGTIQGSLASTKAAWQNLVTAFGTGEDLTKPIENLVDSASNVVNNIIPIAEKAVTGIAGFIEKVAPIIAEKIPPVIQKILPVIISAAQTLLQSLVSAFPQLLSILLEVLPQVAETGVQMLTTLVQGLADALPTLVPQIVEIVTKIVEILTEPDTLSQLIVAAVQIIGALIQGLIQAIPSIIAAIPRIIQAIVQALGTGASALADAGFDLLGHLADKFGEVGSWLVEKAKQIPSMIVEGLGNLGSWFVEIGSNWLSSIWTGFGNMWEKVKGKMSEWGGNVVSWVKSVFGIASPSKVFKKIGVFLGEGLGEGIEDSEKKAVDAAARMAKNVKDASEKIVSKTKVKLTADEIKSAQEFVSNHNPLVGGTSGANATATASASKGESRTVILQVDKTVFAKMVYDLYNSENKRVGVKINSKVGVAYAGGTA